MEPQTNLPATGYNSNPDSGSAVLAARLVLPVLAACLLVALLLLALPATAGAAPATPQRQGTAPTQAVAQTSAAEPGKGKRDEVVGVVVAVPTDSPDGFVGNWQIALNSRRTLTVVVTVDTKIAKNFDGPPRLGDAVQVRGAKQADGSLLAKRLRPNKYESGEVVVRLAASAEITQAITRLERRYDLVLIDKLLWEANIYLFASSDDIQEDAVLRKMNEDSAIQWAELNYISGVPADPEGNPYRTWKWGSSDASGYENQTALQQINLLPGQRVVDGAGVIVAVLDTGVDASHPALAGRLLPGTDLVNEDNVPQDGPEAGEEPGLAQGHGTHISGIVTRIAPQSKILPVRVLDVNGRGNIYVLAYAIEWAADHGADVINLSLGSDFDSQVLSDAIADAQQRGVVIVAAAGNDGVATPQYPANFPGVLGVTAVDSGNHKADFANYGDGWIDLAAPGVGITSTVPFSPVLYAAWSGTSMAVPFVTGAAALVKQQQPDAAPAEVADRLIAAGADLDAANPQYAGQLGRLLDISRAIGVAPVLYLPMVQR